MAREVINVKVSNLSSNLARKIIYIASGDRADSRFAFEQGIPEGVFADSVSGKHAYTGYYDPVSSDHVLYPLYPFLDAVLNGK